MPDWFWDQAEAADLRAKARQIHFDLLYKKVSPEVSFVTTPAINFKVLKNRPQKTGGHNLRFDYGQAELALIHTLMAAEASAPERNVRDGDPDPDQNQALDSVDRD